MLAGIVSSLRLSYFKPTQGYHYSNTGYTILGEIISRVYSVKSHSRKSYADYINDYITGPSAKIPLHLRFPDMATDVTLPNPYVKGTEFLRDSTKVFDKYNVSAHIAEGNGYGTMDDLNNFVRSLMKGNNVLEPATVSIMQDDVSSNNSAYALGCTYRENFGYGHNGAKIGYLDVMAYDPETDVSLVVMLPLWDLRNDMQSFGECFNAIYDAGYAARSALGFPGKPN
jgi:D-alanyl-D-alanine carboxypeptidase